MRELQPAKPTDPRMHSEKGYQLLRLGLVKEVSVSSLRKILVLLALRRHAHSFKALGSFRRANDRKGQLTCDALIAREEGREFRAGGKHDDFLACFQIAVDLFTEVSREGDAAFCLEEMGRLEGAAGKLPNHCTMAL